MDREAAVIRAEMTQTRADLDSKLSRLEARAREMTPRRYMQRTLPEYFFDRVIGGVLTCIGLTMAVRQYRANRDRRERMRAALMPYECW
jgi:hypothetical protein